MNKNIRQVSIKLNDGMEFNIVEVNLDFTFRTEPVLRSFCQDGEWYQVHTWTTLSGKSESYISCYAEALHNGFN